MNSATRKRICWVTTTPFIVNSFLRPHLEALACRYDVTLALNLDDGYPLRAIDGLTRVAAVPIRRKISPVGDVVALFALVREMVRGGYDAVHTFAPKAGLLGMLAAWIARVPVRMHTFQGEVWASRRGTMRALLRLADVLIAKLATQVLVVGAGERSFLEGEGVLTPGRGIVLGNGSIAGVDIGRFRPDPQARARVREKLGVGESQFLILYLGRLARDKGVLDLTTAFSLAGPRIPDAMLVFVGPDEEGLSEEIRACAGTLADRVRLEGYTERPEDFLAAASFVCVPSYREGFSTVILEAAACGVPAVASRIYGTQDALIDGLTGRFHAPANVEELVNAICDLAKDAARCTGMGRAARDRVLERFRVERLVSEMLLFYEHTLGAGEVKVQPRP